MHLITMKMYTWPRILSIYKDTFIKITSVQHYYFWIYDLKFKIDFMTISFTRNFTIFTQFSGSFSLRLEKLLRLEKNDLSKVSTRVHF